MESTRNSWMLIGIISTILIVRTSSEPQITCPGSAEGCLVQAGISPGIGDKTKFCTETPAKVDLANLCLQKCGFSKPGLLLQVLNDLNFVCSATSGCESFVEKYNTFRSCYNYTDELEGLVDNVIRKYNGRALQMDDCMSLRMIRGCMRRTSKDCRLLGEVYGHLSSAVDKFDLALLICGAENVVSGTKTDGCESASQDIRDNCDYACELTAASTAGDVCSLLQEQSNCILRQSKGCTEALVPHLLPRLQTYSIVNQLFLCNVSFDGVVVLPSFGQECSYKEVLDACFDVQFSQGLPLISVKKLLNGDLPSADFCSKISHGDDPTLKCSKSLWPCSVPLAQVYPRKPEVEEFDSSLGAFPLSDFGLTVLLDGCKTGETKPGLACPIPDYEVLLPTPARPLKFTTGARLRTPGAESRN